MSIQPASNFTPRPVDWLWPGRLALGKLALFDGDPDLGKSFVSLDLCARLSAGRPFPDCTNSCAPESSLVLNAEDNAADTIVPRLLALGADLQRVFLWPCEDKGLPRLPRALKQLEAALVETHARLVVIDPLMAFLDESVCIGSDQGVRAALQPLMDLAQERHAAILLLRHLNKKVGGPSLYRGGGSIAFSAACRLNWLVGRNPRRRDQYVLAQHKNNLGPPQPSLSYTFTAQPAGLPRLDWLGPSPWSAAQLVARARPSHSRDRAAAFLREYLKDGPRAVADLWPAARKRRLSKGTLNRAKNDLGVRCHRVAPFTPNQKSYWLLPGQELPPEAEPGHDPLLDKIFKELEEKYPRRVPLEEDEGP